MGNEVKRKLKLINEALMDWKAGKLTDLAALTAIHIIAKDNTKVSPEAQRWANDIDQVEAIKRSCSPSTALIIRAGGMTYA